MPKYTIRVQRTVVQEATIVVEAEDQEQAKDAVVSAEAPEIVEKLSDAEWDLDDEDYEVLGCEEVVQ